MDKNVAKLCLFVILLFVNSTANAEEYKENALLEISSPLHYIPQNFDVIHYDLFLDLSAENPLQTHGANEITVLWKEGSEREFYFHLRSLEPDSIIYQSIYQSEKLAFVKIEEEDDYYYSVNLPEGEDSTRIKVFFSGTMTGEEKQHGLSWGGVHYDRGMVFALGVGFYNNYVSTTRHWMPCYDHPSDKATFKAAFKVKSDDVAASVGLLAEITENQDGSKTYIWNHDIPCATYLMTFAAGPYQKQEMWKEELPIEIYTLAEDSAASVHSYERVPEMAAAFERRFGDYPFDKIGYVNATVGAMEHQTMITMNRQTISDYMNSGDTINSTVAHELAHQWFGNMVSPLDFRNAWLNESFATFCEAVWMEQIGGRAAYLDKITEFSNSYIYSASRNEGVLPLYDYSRVYPSSNYPWTIYVKGAVVVGMLRYKLGEAAFFDYMKSFLQDYAYGCATTSELKLYLEEKSGSNLDTFFEQWIMGIGFPKITVKINKNPFGNEGKVKLEINIKQVQPEEYGIYRELPIEFCFSGESGESCHIFEMNDKEQNFIVAEADDFQSVTVNRGDGVRAMLQVMGLLVGTEDELLAEKIEIIPNPADDYFRVTLPSEYSGGKAEVFNAAGVSVFKTDLPHSSSEINIVTESKSWQSGMYYLQISGRKSVITRNISIVH